MVYFQKTLRKIMNYKWKIMLIFKVLTKIKMKRKKYILNN